MLSDFHYIAPYDKIAKLLIEKHVPTYLYVLNTTTEAFRAPHWRRVPHDTELLWLTGAPFMDVGTCIYTYIHNVSYFYNSAVNLIFRT